MSCCAAIDEVLHLAESWARSGGRLQPAVDPLDGGHGVAMLPDVATEAALLVRGDPVLADMPAQREVIAKLLDELKTNENRSYERVEQLRALLQSLRPRYIGHAFERVRRLCDDDPKAHEALHALADAIVSDLRARGWSDEALLRVSDNGPEGPRELVGELEAKLNVAQQEFRCFVPLSGPDEQLLGFQEEEFSVVPTVPAIPQAGRTLSSGPFAQVSVMAYDPHAAASIAKLRVQSVVGAAAVFLPRVGLRVAGGVVAVEHAGLLHNVDTDHGLLEENRSTGRPLGRIVGAAWNASARPAADPLYDAIRLRHRAQLSGDWESRLLLLWSAIERITSGARGYTGAISAAKALIGRSIALGKIRRDVGDIAAVMGHQLDEGQRNDALRLVGGYRDSSGRPQIDRMRLLERLLGSQGDLDQLVHVFYDDHPLLVRRCFSLWNDLGRGASSERGKHLAELLESSRLRVEWQVGRIYLARNRIAHVGVGPDRVRDLVWHAHFYSTQLVAICVHYGGGMGPHPQEQLPRRAGVYDAYLALLRAEDPSATAAEALMRPTKLFQVQPS